MKPKWKVVNKKDRGSIFARCDGFKKYYGPGRIVEETPDSVGIMVFRTKRDAENFLIRSGKFDTGEIIKVTPIGKAKIVKNICVTPTNKKVMEKYYKLVEQMKMYERNKDSYSLRRGYDIYNQIGLMSGEIPDGTQCYPAVKVLEPWNT
jgi:hypothetical protein